jgi:hypothetical protein
MDVYNPEAFDQDVLDDWRKRGHDDAHRPHEEAVAQILHYRKLHGSLPPEIASLMPAADKAADENAEPPKRKAKKAKSEHNN